MRFLLSLLLVLSFAAPAFGETATFEFTDGRDTFLIQLRAPAKIRQARKILSRKLPRIVMGKISKRAASYNPGWSYHMLPKSIDFAELTMEVCDASIAAVEANLDEVGGAFLPGGYWCPWHSRLIKERKTNPVKRTR